MAKKAGKSKGAVSAGIHSNVNRQVTNQMRRDYMASGMRYSNQRAAWLRGKNVVLTIENPNREDTKRRYIRVNAREVWGHPKHKN